MAKTLANMLSVFVAAVTFLAFNGYAAQPAAEVNRVNIGAEQHAKDDPYRRLFVFDILAACSGGHQTLEKTVRHVWVRLLRLIYVGCS